MIANRVSTIAERKRNINFIVSFVNITLSFQNKNRPVPLFQPDRSLFMLRISKGKIPGDILFFIVGRIIAAVIVGIGVLIGRSITLICGLLLRLLIRLSIVHRRLLCK